MGYIYDYPNTKTNLMDSQLLWGKGVALDYVTYYDKILRICGDRPFFNISLYEDLISKARESDFDLLTNIFPRTVPPGLTGEIIKLEAIKRTLSLTKNSFDSFDIVKIFFFM